jgi:hypothetical protein
MTKEDDDEEGKLVVAEKVAKVYDCTSKSSERTKELVWAVELYQFKFHEKRSPNCDLSRQLFFFWMRTPFLLLRR